MPRDGYMNLKAEQDLVDRVKTAAAEDDRTINDQLRYLLKIGLRYRDVIKRETEAITQINMPNTPEERGAMLERSGLR